MYECCRETKVITNHYLYIFYPLFITHPSVMEVQIDLTVQFLLWLSLLVWEQLCVVATSILGSRILSPPVF